MNTGTRRFILRLIVGLLTFMIGVGAVMLLGGFRPFQSFSSEPYYRHRHYYYYHRSWSPSPPEAPLGVPESGTYTTYTVGPNGIRVRTELRQSPLPPPAPFADAPMPPNPPRVLR